MAGGADVFFETHGAETDETQNAGAKIRKMASQDLVLCIDIGGDSIKAAEFSFPSGNTPVLDKFAYVEFSSGIENDGLNSSVAETLVNMIQQNQFQ